MDVVANEKRYLNDFIRLNEDWISHYFELEEIDRKLAENPYQIVEDGGHIFSLLDDGEVAGVCALFKTGQQEFELARMAVDPKYQGRGFGAMLIEKALMKSKDEGAERVYLLSNKSLDAALALYKKMGFITVSEGQHPIYARADIEMEVRFKQ